MCDFSVLLMLIVFIRHGSYWKVDELLLIDMESFVNLVLILQNIAINQNRIMSNMLAFKLNSALFLDWPKFYDILTQLPNDASVF